MRHGIGQEKLDKLQLRAVRSVFLRKCLQLNASGRKDRGEILGKLALAEFPLIFRAPARRRIYAGFSEIGFAPESATAIKAAACHCLAPLSDLAKLTRGRSSS